MRKWQVNEIHSVQCIEDRTVEVPSNLHFPLLILIQTAKACGIPCLTTSDNKHSVQQ